MIGPEFQTTDDASQVAAGCGSDASIAPASGWRRITIFAALIPLSFVFVQCGQIPGAVQHAANSHAPTGDAFDDRFPKAQFRDRFPPGETFEQRPSPDSPLKRTAQAEHGPYRVASLAPTAPYQRAR